MTDKECSYVEIRVRFFDGKCSPVERLAQVKEMMRGLAMIGQFEEIECEIGEHTGACAPGYCDQVEEGFH